MAKQDKEVAEGNIYQLLLKVQAQAVAPREISGKFGKARSAEQILKAYRPVCRKYGLYLFTTDRMIELNGRNYVTATATVINTAKPEEVHSAEASAWENEVELSKSGSAILDTAQVTGKTGSYAKKYALQNLFAIDDTKDPDFDAEEVDEDMERLRELMVEAGIEPRAINAKLKTLNTEEKVSNAIKAMEKKLADGRPSTDAATPPPEPAKADGGEVVDTPPEKPAADLDQGNVALLRSLMEADGIEPRAIDARIKALDTNESVIAGIKAMQKALGSDDL
jgi:hypothetical protein